eukprot:TRINITY_DN47779_c0_g1_i1.p2 TRINITY_DN47779_c0_g1~~TRINITY_DN47779_c0_g1_i1.p2  ORF type:complete len:146 (+),score=59.85 TRINITY_DN47779_c0_g1_i1:62-439(+)
MATDCVSNPKTASDRFTTLFLLKEAKSLSGKDYTRAKDMVLSGRKEVPKKIYEMWNSCEQGTIDRPTYNAAVADVLYPPPPPTATAANGGGESKADQIRELWQMKVEGALTQSEFEQLKRSVIQG